MKIARVDFDNPVDAAAYRDQLDHYANDPMGIGRSLPAGTSEKVAKDLARLANAMAYLACIEGKAVGFATCFSGYSTFRARPLWNIHDIAVMSHWRGKGIASALIKRIADDARAAGCCKLTLEVREDNPTAERLYRKLGFSASTNAEQEIPYRFLERLLGGK